MVWLCSSETVLTEPGLELELARRLSFANTIAFLLLPVKRYLTLIQGMNVKQFKNSPEETDIDNILICPIQKTSRLLYALDYPFN